MRDFSRRMFVVSLTSAALLLSLGRPAVAQQRRNADRKARTGATASQQEFKSKLMGATGRASARSENTLSTGLSELSNGKYSSSTLNGLAGQLAAGLRRSNLDEQQADRVSSSFRTILGEGSTPSDIASARAQIEQSLSQAGVGERQLSRIQKELSAVLDGEPRMSPQQQRNVQKLSADLAKIRSGSTVTPEQVQKLGQSLMTMADGANRPSQHSVDALANDLANALADSQLSRREQMQLAQSLEDVLTSANISSQEFAAVVDDVEEILVASGVSRNEMATIKADLETIYAELQSQRR